MSKKPKKYIRVKNKLPELLEALYKLDDLPKWLDSAIYEAFNNRTGILTFSADYWRDQIKSSKKTAKFNKWLKSAKGKKAMEKAEQPKE